MPYLNRFKRDMLHTIMLYKEHITEEILDDFEIEENDLRTTFLPTFRISLEEQVIHPCIDTLNLNSLKE